MPSRINPSHRTLVTLVALAFSAACLNGQSITIERLRKVIGEAVAHHLSDKDLGRRVTRFELTQRVTEDILADLQSRAPGPATAAALTELAQESAFLEPPASDLPQIPPPSLAEQKLILDRAADYAVTYAKRLPNLMCTETVRRFDDNGGVFDPETEVLGSFQFRDTIVGQLTYSNHQEHIRITSVHRADRGGSGNVAGLQTNGEFGNIMISLFTPIAHAAASWNHWELTHGKQIAVFQYRVSAANSAYLLSYCCEAGAARHLRPAYQGTVSIDPATGAVMRLTLIATGMPNSFAMRQADMAVQYAPVTVGEKSYLCPIRSVTRSAYVVRTAYSWTTVHYLNEISFSNYKKFEVESSLVASGQVSHPAPPVYEVPEPAATPKVSAVYDQPPPLLDDEKAPRREPETLAEALFPAPQPPPFEEPLSAPSRVTFKERVNVVTVPVVVRDAHGDLVTGLGKDDFELLDNRKPRPITSFAEEQSSGTVSATLARASAFNSNAPASNNAVRPSSPHTPRYVAFIFDDIHLETGNLAEVRSAVQRTLAGLLQPMTRVALVTTSGHIVTGFSADRDQLVTTLNRIQANPVMKPRSVCPDISFYQADRIVNNEERDALSAATEDAFIQCGIPEDQPDLARATAQSAARQIVAAYEYAARAALRFVQTVVDRMAGLPGERSVILVSPGFMARPGSPDTEAIIDRAVRNGIVINALDSRGLAVLPGSSAETGASGTAHSQIVNRRYENDEQNLQSDVLIQLADATGGLTFRNSNDYDAGLNSLTEEPRLIYLLGFSPDNDAHPGYHRLKVSVRGRHNLDLQARRGYVIDRRTHNAE